MMPKRILRSELYCFLVKDRHPRMAFFLFAAVAIKKARGKQGYVGQDGYHRLNILEVQRIIRFMPKVVIAVIPGWAVGGGHSLHVVCDLSLASEEHAIF